MFISALRSKFLIVSPTLLSAAIGLFASVSPVAEAEEYVVVFDSNRSGTFGIYSKKIGSTVLSTLVDTALHEVYPDVSPDGTTIAFARGASARVGTPRDIWLMNFDGSNQRHIVENGSFPSFSADGATIYFLRERKRVMSVNLDGSNEIEIFPLAIEPFAGRELAVPRLSPNKRYIAFTMDLPSKWKTWVYDFSTKEGFMVGHGCEPTWNADSKSFFWVERGQFQSKSALSIFNVETRSNAVFQDSAEPHGQEYFPFPSADGKRLVWSACPVTQHSHETANYQIFWRDRDQTERVRLTEDGFTNRWPKIVPVPNSSAQSSN